MLAATPRLAQWLVAPVLLGGVYIAWQARVEPHYLIPLLPLLAALAARCLGSFRQVGPTRIRLGVSAGLAVMAIVGVWMTIGWSRQLRWSSQTRARRVQLPHGCGRTRDRATRPSFGVTSQRLLRVGG